MAIRARLDTEAYKELGEAVQALYKADPESEGEYVLDVEPVDGFGLANTDKLKSALQSERATVSELKRAAKRLKELEDAGIKEPADAQKLSANATQVREQFEAKLAEAAKEREALANELNRSKLTSAVRDALPAGTRTKLLMPHLMERVGVLEDGSIAVMDEKGNPLPSAKLDSADPMRVDEYIEKLRHDDEYGACFPPTESSGSGTSRSNGKATRTEAPDSPLAKINAGLR